MQPLIMNQAQGIRVMMSHFLKNIFNRRAQHTMEYVLLITLVAAALAASYSFINYLIQGRLQQISEYVQEEEPETP
ncbi:MAG: hypothetical protein NC826_05040 [Candidatus Omnitrophica bacterium]|nr:hypothetical protein [Candidatus Omnitrophota bacterium]